MKLDQAKTLHRKSVPVLGMKAFPEEGPGVFGAFVSVFGNVDFQNERGIPGMFAASLDRWKSSGDPIPVIFSHQWDDLPSHLGIVTEAEEVPPGDSRLPLEIRSLGGLWTKFRLDVDDQMTYAPRVAQLLERRSLKEFSFAYAVDEFRIADGVTELVAVDLFEVGPTLKGANPLTQLLSRGAKSLDERRAGFADALAKNLEELGEPELAAQLSGLASAPAKAWLELTGSAEQLQRAAYDAAFEWASTSDAGNGGFYALYLEATFADRLVVLVEGWADPIGEGVFFEFDLSFDPETRALVLENAREVEIVGEVTTTPKSLELARLKDARRRAKSDEGSADDPEAGATVESQEDAEDEEQPGASELEDNPGDGGGSEGEENGEDSETEADSKGTGEASRLLTEIEILDLELA